MEQPNDNVPYPAPKGKVWKTGSNSEFILVDDPNLFNAEGRRIKKRNKNTHLTPKKKKRK